MPKLILSTASAYGKVTLPSHHLGFARAGFHEPSLAGFGKCGTPSKVRRISYDLSLWQSYVAQPSPRLHSGRVSCAAPRGVWQMHRTFEGAPHLLQPRLVAKLRCPTITSASVGQGFMRRPSRDWQMPSSFFFHHQPTRNTSCVPTNGFG